MITTGHKNNLCVTLTNGEHTITADVGKDLGGDDCALNPHELLESSLASCTTITILLYARRKQWPLTDVITKVRVVSEKGDLNEIVRNIEFKGELTEEQRHRLSEIADKCPMHKFLMKGSVIVTSIK
jgi:putative redox protein